VHIDSQKTVLRRLTSVWEKGWFGEGVFQICGLNIVGGSGERVEKLTSKGSASPLYVGVSGTGGVGKTLFLQIVYGMPSVQHLL